MKTRMFLSTFLALSLTAAAASAADDAPVAPPADGADNAAAVAESAEDKRSAQLDRFCPDSTASRIKRRSGNEAMVRTLAVTSSPVTPSPRVAARRKRPCSQVTEIARPSNFGSAE